LIPVESADAEPVQYNAGGINSGMFYTRSRFATTTALSSTDAEHQAITECVKTIILFRGVLDELRLTQLRPTPLFNDNESAIILGMNYSGNTKNIRYIIPRITWLVEQVKGMVCQLFHTGTADIPPDVQTKPLEAPDFERKRSLMMLGTVVPK
jgi:hypothetical protein